MSSIQAFPHSAVSGQGTTYYSAYKDISLDTNDHLISVSTLAGSDSAGVMKDTGKNELFPNSTAHPVKASFSFNGYRSGFNWVRVRYQVNRTTVREIQYSSNSKSYSDANITDSVLLNSIKSTDIRFVIEHGSATGGGIVNLNLTYYFNCYDFSATAGTDVTSASVSSSTGYGGGSITFSCVIPTGYVFDGWYKAGAQTPYSTAQTFTYTIPTDNAVDYDLALTAKAHQDTHNVNGTYNGSTKAILTGVTGNVAVGYNGKSATLSASSTSHTLSCSGKVMRGNVSVGSASLATSGKIMKSNLVLNYV